MSREPTAEQIEAVAHELYAAGPWGEPFCFLQDGVGMVTISHTMDVYREMAREAIAAMNAEPLTSTPQLSTTETGCQPIIQLGAGLTGSPLGPQQFDPPPGFEYEYRAVHRRGLRSEPWTTDGELVRRYVAADDYYRLERRLVGPPERIEEE